MELFAQFIQERLYLKGVSPKTVISYQCAFKAFAGAPESKTAMMCSAPDSGSARFRAFMIMPAITSFRLPRPDAIIEALDGHGDTDNRSRSEEHTSELQSL